MSTRELLVQLGGLQVRVRVEDGQLRYAAPKGALTPDLRESLVQQKPSLLKLLGRAGGSLGMTLRQFGGAGCCLEVQVPGLSETVSFVSGQEEVERLRKEGVPRGRIWTASELRDLIAAPGMTHEDALAVARVKLMFNAQISDAPAPESTRPLVDPQTTSSQERE